MKRFFEIFDCLYNNLDHIQNNKKIYDVLCEHFNTDNKKIVNINVDARKVCLLIDNIEINHSYLYHKEHDISIEFSSENNSSFYINIDTDELVFVYDQYLNTKNSTILYMNRSEKKFYIEENFREIRLPDISEDDFIECVKDGPIINLCSLLGKYIITKK